jgi:hypothetical protein
MYAFNLPNLQNVLSFECHNLQDTQASKDLQEMHTKYNLRKELAISNERHTVVFIYLYNTKSEPKFGRWIWPRHPLTH